MHKIVGFMSSNENILKQIVCFINKKVFFSPSTKYTWTASVQTIHTLHKHVDFLF